MTIQRGMHKGAIFLALLLILGLTGCGVGSEEGAGEQEGQQEAVTTTFKLDLSSILDDANIATGQVVESLETTASGQLMIVPFNGTPFPVFPFEVALEEGSLTLTTDLQVNLDPSLYTFYMLLNLTFGTSTHSYAGIAPVLIVDGGENTVTMTLSPLLLSVGINKVEDLVNLTSLIVYYPEDIATYTDPRFGIIVDGGEEIIFRVNSISNESNFVTIYLLYREAPYQINTRFYDGAVITEGGVDDIIEPPPPSNPPTEIAVEPLQAEVKYAGTLNDNTGEISANFFVPIPGEVLTEVGGAGTTGSPLDSRLKTVLSIIDGAGTLTEEVVPLGSDSGSISIEAFTSGAITWSLSFYRLDPGTGTSQQIAYCASQSDLTGQQELTLLCNLLLLDGDIITDHPPATLTISVVDSVNNIYLSGAVITANGETVAITGDGSDGAAGTSDIFLQEGTYLFQATVAGLDPSSSVEVVLSAGASGSIQLVIIGLEPPPVPDTTPPGLVTGLIATAGDSNVVMSWVNPGDDDFAGVRVIRGSGAVSHDATGLPVWDLSSSQTALTDDTAVNGSTYTYSVFTYDTSGNFSAAATAVATPEGEPDPNPPVLEPIVLTASRQFRPREYIDGDADLSFLNEGESITVSIPTMEDVSVLFGSEDHYLLIVYLGDVKCMYLGGKRDRHLGGLNLDGMEDVFEKAFKSPACIESGFGRRHWNFNRNQRRENHHFHREGGWYSHPGDGVVTTSGPIRARVITGNPHYDITTVEVTIPVLSINEP